MIGTVPGGVFYGAALGAAAGYLSRLALRKVLGAGDPVFYSVFAAGISLRFALLAAAVCLLRHEKHIITIAFAVSCILAQIAFGAVPLKHGTKTDT